MPHSIPPDVAQDDLNSRFTYRSERGERWRILSASGPVQGDCEDYALTMIWLTEGQSMFRFWLSLLTVKYLIWYCKAPTGEGHAILWMRGIGWTDNIQRQVVPSWRDLRAKGYRCPWPYLVPLVALKFALRPLLKRK